jgi:predicted Co/Zn/Cd cation transporter (cation efflux family)
MIGKMKVDLDFLKMKLEKMSEILEDIEVAINRIEEKFPISETQVYINKIGQIDLIVVLKK